MTGRAEGCPDPALTHPDHRRAGVILPGHAAGTDGANRYGAPSGAERPHAGLPDQRPIYSHPVPAAIAREMRAAVMFVLMPRRCWGDGDTRAARMGATRAGRFACMSSPGTASSAELSALILRVNSSRSSRNFRSFNASALLTLAGCLEPEPFIRGEAIREWITILTLPYSIQFGPSPPAARERR